LRPPPAWDELGQRLLATFKGPRDVALAVINGAVGDRLARAGSPLATEMALLRYDPWRAFGVHPHDTRPRACVLVHGLMGSELAWGYGTVGANRSEFGHAIADARDVTPIYVRYNTGQHISTNGRELAERLDLAFATWPDLEEISVIAHSMGGLVMRSACHYAMQAKYPWVERLRRVFLLGVPSHGAPWEQIAHVAAFTLDAIWNPWTKIIGKAINLRSAGIKDLRHGFVLDEDWLHLDPDVLALRVPRKPIETPHVRWFVAAGTLGEHDGVIAKLIGDGCVRGESCEGRGFGSPAPGVLPEAQVRVFGRTSHIALMSAPAVLEQLLEWW
jgi:pimeloyl-ACP methyl ester carboxylesterase